MGWLVDWLICSLKPNIMAKAFSPEFEEHLGLGLHPVHVEILQYGPQLLLKFISSGEEKDKTIRGKFV